MASVPTPISNSHVVAFVAAMSLVPSLGRAQSYNDRPPCEALSESAAVFVGVARAPVTLRVQLPDNPTVDLKLTPIDVERTYSGVTPPVMFLTPLGSEIYATPGRRYLVYGQRYRPPDIVMAGPGHGAKPIEEAEDDLAYLDLLSPSSVGGTIVGLVRQKAHGSDKGDASGTPLAGVHIAIRKRDESKVEEVVTAAVTDAEGRFVVAGLPAGLYQIVPALPDDLVLWDSTMKAIGVRLGDGGCAIASVDTLANGRVRGVLHGPDGRPLSMTSVDLVPMDVAADSTGHVRGMGSVRTDEHGRFEFAGRTAGRYYLGVSLYNAPNPYGSSYPRTYYPGTTDRAAAVPVVVEAGRAREGLDFSIPTVLGNGQLQVTVEGDRPGTLHVCIVSLDAPVRRWSEYRTDAGTPLSFPVVDGERYQVHAHLEWSSGHLESEPYEFTATTQKTIVTLRPDTPRVLHR